ncbi:hypothetical protein [Burkholderia phage FLC9]|nr:hypothetical protein [Burkholderia phage FLC9]
MEQNSDVYNMYTTFKNAGRFNYAELMELFKAGRPQYTWEDTVVLQTLVHNLAIGRPNWPNLVDAIVADRSLNAMRTLFMYGIIEEKIVNPNCFRFQVLVLPHGSAEPLASFEAVMRTPNTTENTIGWFVDRIEVNSSKIYSIAEPCFPMDTTTEQRFSSYTIFDNLGSSVEFKDQGTLYLQCLQEQVRQYAGQDTEDLFQKFRTYADCMLEMHNDYKCGVRYEHIGEGKVRLQVSVYSDEAVTNNRYYIVQFDHILNKVR